MAKVKYFLGILFIFFLMLVCFNTKPETKSKHFSQIHIGEYNITGKDIINGEDTLNSNCYKFTYDDKKRIVLIEYKEDNILEDSPVYGFSKIIINYEDNIERRYFYDRQSKNIYNGNFIELERAGDVLTKVEKDSAGLILQDSLGISKYILIFNSTGHLQSMSFYDENEKLIQHPVTGVAFIVYEYNDKGYLAQVSAYGCDSTLTMSNDENISIIRMKYDEFGNQIEKAYYGVDNKLTYSKSKQCAIEKYKYDSKGRMLEMSVYDTNNELMDYKDYGISVIRYKYDNNGNIIEEKAYDKNMNPLN